MEKVLDALKKAAARADVIEIWIDEIEDLDIPKLLKAVKKPLLIKITEKFELIDTLKDKVAYIDVDINAKVKLPKSKTKFIISFHDYKKTPSVKELEEIVQKAFEKGADIAKVATHAECVKDNIKIMSLLRKFRKKKIIAIAMGLEGRASRYMGLVLGNFLNYAALNEKSKTAKGQLTVDKVNQITKWRSK
ncbi:type I 3-dehydroquinate dehydratase [Patescibacteria group bacterium]|nr:type I 3-dehydroquinate dehydratase [Patescibacteria group bacterium]